MPDVNVDITGDSSDAVAAANQAADAIGGIENAGERAGTGLLNFEAGISLLERLNELASEFLGNLDEIDRRTLGVAGAAARFGVSLLEAQAIQALAGTVGADTSDIFGALEQFETDVLTASRAGTINPERQAALAASGIDLDAFEAQGGTGRISTLIDAAAGLQGDPQARTILTELLGGEDAGRFLELGALRASTPEADLGFIQRIIAAEGGALTRDLANRARLDLLRARIAEQVLVGEQAGLTGFAEAFETAPLLGGLVQGARDVTRRIQVDIRVDQEAARLGIAGTVNDGIRSGQIGTTNVDRDQ